MQENLQFKPTQKVFLNSRFDVNKKLATGLKKGGIYTIDEVIKCNCGEILLVLSGVYYPGVNARMCVCGKDDFPANAFYSKRFEIVNLRVV